MGEDAPNQREADGGARDPEQIIEHLRAELSRERKRNRELMALLEEDTLCRCPNRRGIERAIRQAIAHAERHDTPISVALIDLDEFKTVNDMLGHDAGDRVLRETARLLTHGVRSSDFVGRLGGDEFVVIFWHSRPAAAARRLSGQCARIAELVPDQARAAGFGASYGVVSITHGSTVASLLQDADRQMYRRKAGRKGGSARRNSPSAGSGHGRGGSFDPDAPAPDGAEGGDAPNVHPSVPAGSGRSDNSRVDIPGGRS